MGNSYSFYKKIYPLTEKKTLISCDLNNNNNNTIYIFYRYIKNKSLKSLTKYSGMFSK